MNPLQMALQMRHLLRAVRWPTGAAQLVFGERNVVVYAGVPTPDQMLAAVPCAYIGIDAGDNDPDHPELIQQRFTVVVVAEAKGDQLGQAALIGGSVANLGKSAGRGVDEVCERVRDALAALTGVDGAKILLWGTASGGPIKTEAGAHVALRELAYTGLCTSALHYAAPQRLRHSGGVWTWDGDHCSARFDFVHYRVVRKTGTSPSTTPADGIAVYTGTSATFAGAATAGNVYTVFADYANRRVVASSSSSSSGDIASANTAAVEGSSDPERGSYRVVTA